MCSDLTCSVFFPSPQVRKKVAYCWSAGKVPLEKAHRSLCLNPLWIRSFSRSSTFWARLSFQDIWFSQRSKRHIPTTKPFSRMFWHSSWLTCRKRWWMAFPSPTMVKGFPCALHVCAQRVIGLGFRTAGSWCATLEGLQRESRPMSRTKAYVTFVWQVPQVCRAVTLEAMPSGSLQCTLPQVSLPGSQRGLLCNKWCKCHPFQRTSSALTSSIVGTLAWDKTLGQAAWCSSPKCVLEAAFPNDLKSWLSCGETFAAQSVSAAIRTKKDIVWNFRVQRVVGQAMHVLQVLVAFSTFCQWEILISVSDFFRLYSWNVASPCLNIFFVFWLYSP